MLSSKRELLLFAVLFVFILSIRADDRNLEKNNMNAREMLEKADQLFKSRKYNEAQKIYEQVITLAENVGDNSSLTEAYAMAARSYLILDKKEEGRPLIKEAGEIANESEPLGWSRFLGVLGRFEWRDKELDKSMTTFEKMYDYCSENMLHSRAIDAAHMVAIVGPPEIQVEWGMKGIREAEKGNITGWLGPLWNNLGATYEDMEKYPEALKAYLKAREYHKKHGDEFSGMVADWAVGHAYRLNGNFEKAEKLITPLMEAFKKIESVEFVGWTCKELAEIEISKKNYKTAIDLLELARKNLEAEKMPDWDPEGYKKLQEQIIETKLLAKN